MLTIFVEVKVATEAEFTLCGDVRCGEQDEERP
jgi:hypothetical protein